MTDKALEAAAKALAGAEWDYPNDKDRFRREAREVISAYLSALPGEAEVVAFMHPLSNWAHVLYSEIDMHCPKDGPRPIPLVTLASLQAMQARAEKAERERDCWQKQHDDRTFFLGQCATEKEAAEARAKEAEEAENDTKDCFWAIYPKYLEMGGEPISTEVARTELAKRAEAAEARVKELEAKIALIEEEAEKDNSPLGRSDSLALRNIRTALKGGSNG